MALPTTSRYFKINEEKDNEVIVAAVRKTLLPSSYIIHVTNDGDSFASLASNYLGDERLFWIIADINPQVKFPDLITIGTSIRIPLL
jgi:hypothetical protein